VKSFTEAVGGNDFIVAYGIGSLPFLTMKDMDGCALAHKRLMTLLSKRIHVVMTNGCCNTKGCPTCMDYSLSIRCPKGNQFLINRKEYYHHKACSYKSQDWFLLKTNTRAFTV